jgi:UDP-GlcNAc:undecaprenyl-phosphate GlcNAc-1-phosphate transferase
MVRVCLLLLPVALAVSLLLTAAMIALGHRLRAFDSAGVPGQVKAPPRRVPNTGGVAIFWGVAAPLAGALALAWLVEPSGLPEFLRSAGEHIKGIRQETPAAIWLLAGLGVLHVMGLIDDRRALGPGLKLGVMLAVSAVVLIMTDTRLLTLLDPLAGGAWLSLTISVLWVVVVTNALNFLDNMDGLSGGVGAIASACFLAAALIHQQWFVAAMLALLLGSLLGFLAFNFPSRLAGGSARIFMGDGGSLVLGFLLAFLTARSTFYNPALGGGWYAVFMPVVVLAVPLYDLCSVCVLRLRAGRSPLVGDLNHLSHRLVRRGLSRRDAVLLIYALTGITAISGIALGSLAPWQAILVGVQTLLTLLALAIFEAKADFAKTVHIPGDRP